MGDSPNEDEKISDQLTRLRDSPVNTEGAPDELLAFLFRYLMKQESKPPGKVVHWFCRKATSNVRGCASFLMRLYAYNGDNADMWKARLATCLNSCSECVLDFEVAKKESESTYFGAFEREVVKRFFQSFEEWELSSVKEVLQKAGLIGPSPNPSASLSHIPSALVCRMVSNWTIFQDATILSLIRQQAPSTPLTGWPSDPPPAGVLVLLMDEDQRVRQWAKDVFLRCTTLPLPSGFFVRPYLNAVDAIGLAIERLDVGEHDKAQKDTPFSFSRNPTDFWSGFYHALRLVPPEALAAGTTPHSDLRRAVIRNLNTSGPHFQELFRSFFLLLRRLTSDFWTAGSAEYPLVVFDSIKDNPSFVDMIHSLNSAPQNAQFLAWFLEYLNTILDRAIYAEVLAKVMDFLCEETQHERFGDARPLLLSCGMRVLLSVYVKSTSLADRAYRDTFMNVLEIHGQKILRVAFGSPYEEEKWATPRTLARKVITTVMQNDIDNIMLTVMKLCKVLSQALVGGNVKETIPEFAIRKHLWQTLRLTLAKADGGAVATLLSVVAGVSHIGTLNEKTFEKALRISDVPEGCLTPKVALKECNSSLSFIWEAFQHIISAVADHVPSATVADIVKRPEVAENAMLLMFSPVPQLHDGVQALLGVAFDVDGRQECFRALLENVPDAAVRGILTFLATFNQFAPVVTEACNLSKSLARCLTDVVDVLCSAENGLLHSEKFLQSLDDKKGPGSIVPKLWKLIADSLTVIFKRAPLWSVHFPNQVMVLWMRDVIILGRDLLAQWRVFENAANSQAPFVEVDPRSLSPTGKKMLSSLQSVLLELSRWLRLTDEELLHQSFSLLHSLLDLFRDVGMKPDTVAFEKLQRHIDQAQDAKSARTRLDSTRLVILAAALDEFREKPEVKFKDVAKGEKTIKKPVMTQPKPTPQLRQTKLDFTKEDQRKLDEAITPAPTLHNVPPSHVPIVGKPIPVPQRNVITGPKNEALAQSSKVAESSSSESEDEEDEEEEGPKGLAALGKPRTPEIKKRVERRQIMTLDIPMHQSAIEERRKRQDEARRAALRLKPDLSGLHRAMLAWDIDHIGPEPPGEKLQLFNIPDKFTDYAHYLRAFQPLLLMECWAQILSAKEELQDPYEIKITSRSFTDTWLDLDVMLTEPVKNDWYLTDTDIVLLEHMTSKTRLMAKTQNFRKDRQQTIMNMRCYIPKGKTDPGLQINSKWRLRKLFSLSTLHREYGALISMQHYDLFNTILQPRLPSIHRADSKDVQRTMQKYKVNEPQAVAILSSLAATGFVLIQGPPGTGKTSTICGLIAATLARRPRPSTAVHVGGNAARQEKVMKQKILLCAPSNAAIDEIAYRIKEDFRKLAKDSERYSVVRVGAKKSINASVQDISLESLVEEKLNAIRAKDGVSEDKTPHASADMAALRSELESVKESLLQKQRERQSTHDNRARIQALDMEISQLNSRRRDIGTRITSLRDQQTAESRANDARARQAQAEVLEQADVICSTLSGAGHDILNPFDFETIIIDEAAQAIELSSLIPLKFRSQKCIMVGDPKQLPPTVLSQGACRYRYNESLFVRLQRHRPDAVHLLSIQYRMHPDISTLPSEIFYEGRLKNGPEMEQKTRRPWHANPKFGTYKFFNVSRGLEDASGHSIKNTAECQVALALYMRLQQEFSPMVHKYRIGVISMYRAQIVELRRLFEQRFGSDIFKTVDFNTVDGFQGQEKDVIILSCVRAGPGLQSVGFLADVRRMNVALTRAKSSLFILGNAATLERSDPNWKNIVTDARSRSALLEISDSSFFSKATNTPTLSPPKGKPASVASGPSLAPIPSDLVTPKNFKAGVLKSSSQNFEAPEPALSVKPEKDSPPSRNKRPADEGPDPINRSAPKESKNQRPPVKRPKPPPNLFIPKTKKRPAEDQAGPSQIKRRS